MKKEEKRRFIEDLLDSVKKSILAKVDKMPDEWDGKELRWYIVDYVNLEVEWERDKRSSRYKEYQNTCIIKNF